MQELNKIEIRIIGALIEKKYTTPDYYPLTLNSLKNACSQKSNRNPVMEIDKSNILRALDNLRDLKLVKKVESANFRVPKYEESFCEFFNLKEDEIAVISVLMLRGAQTLGQLRSRTKRIHEFNSLGEVKETLECLGNKEPAMISEIGRQPGKKENRFIHLLAREPEFENNQTDEITDEKERIKIINENEMIKQLSDRVEQLEKKMNSVEKKLDDFIEQFK